MTILLDGVLFRAFASSPVAKDRDAMGRVWCRLFPLGTWHRADFPGGKIDLTAELLAEFVASWRAGGSPPLPVDYNHDEKGPAAGWIEDLRQIASGELEGAVKWTDDAEAEIKADKRRFLSPTWSMAHTNRRTGAKGGPWLYGAGLLNDPFYDSMPRVAAAALPTQPTPQHHENAMTEAELKLLRAKLGLADNATAEAVITAAHPRQDVTEKLTAALKTQSESFDAKLKASQDDLAKLKAERHAEQVEAAIEAGKREGRALDALKPFILAASSLDDAKKMIAAVSITVPLVTAGIPGVASGTTDDSAKAQAELDVLVAAKMTAGLSFRDAHRAVGREHKQLADRAFNVPTTHAANAEN